MEKIKKQKTGKSFVKSVVGPVKNRGKEKKIGDKFC